jgi:dihydrodipicolinate synthase/N-acetylneuraminate lyase
MNTLIPGLVHTPVTPFTAELKIDYACLEKLLEFHLRSGAQAIATPMHVAESVSLSDAEQRAHFDFVMKHVGGRVPVLAHVSDSATGVAASRADYAQSHGAQAIICTSPYYWTPPAHMVHEHFAQVAKAAQIPFYVFYTPSEMTGTKLSTELMLQLVHSASNFAGLVDLSMDWQFMINIISNVQRIRPEFQLLSGNEYMVSAGAVGAKSMFTPLAGIAPKLMNDFFALCQAEKYFEARDKQEDVATLYQLLKHHGFASLKAAMALMGRDCGVPRPPLDAMSPEAMKSLEMGLNQLSFLSQEPKGW